jgi:uncharacterized HhH-GPD family protein
MDATVANVQRLEPFTVRWPDGEESFEVGWEYELLIGGTRNRLRHGLGARTVYGRQRVHAVTWLGGAVQVEGTEADDYPATHALISVLRLGARDLLRDRAAVPAGYEGLTLVDHRREIDAKYSRNCVAVKIEEEDLASWGTHAWLRFHQRQPQAAAFSSSWLSSPSVAPAPPESTDAKAVADALLAHGRAMAAALGGATMRFTPDDAANALIHANPFAFLIAVICDQGITAERAWAIPQQLRTRLGHLDPRTMADHPEEVLAAFSATPKLHRFPAQVAGWVLQAASRVAVDLHGDASALWNDEPSAAALRSRFDALAGIGQKKAAMAVEILERDLHVRVSDLAGGDIAYDVHVRRVFLRTGLAAQDRVADMVTVARVLHPDRPGELDNPTWDIGRRWCHRRNPDCGACPLVSVCPQLISRGDQVKGI